MKLLLWIAIISVVILALRKFIRAIELPNSYWEKREMEKDNEPDENSYS